MKRLISILSIIIIVVTFCSCTQSKINYNKDASTTRAPKNNNPCTNSIILPKVKVESTDLGDKLKNISINQFEIMVGLQDKYLGVKNVENVEKNN